MPQYVQYAPSLMLASTPILSLASSIRSPHLSHPDFSNTFAGKVSTAPDWFVAKAHWRNRIKIIIRKYRRPFYTRPNILINRKAEKFVALFAQFSYALFVLCVWLSYLLVWNGMVHMLIDNRCILAEWIEIGTKYLWMHCRVLIRIHEGKRILCIFVLQKTHCIAIDMHSCLYTVIWNKKWATKLYHYFHYQFSGRQRNDVIDTR